MNWEITLNEFKKNKNKLKKLFLSMLIDMVYIFRGYFNCKVYINV